MAVRTGEAKVTSNSQACPGMERGGGVDPGWGGGEETEGMSRILEAAGQAVACFALS